TVNETMSDQREKLSSPLSMASSEFLDSMHEQYRQDPSTVDPSWRYVFRFLDDVYQSDGTHGELKQLLETELVRRFGHLHAELDPLGLAHTQSPVELETFMHRLVSSPVDIATLHQAYQSGMAVETAHIHDFRMLQWIYDRCETLRPPP